MRYTVRGKPLLDAHIDATRAVNKASLVLEHVFATPKRAALQFVVKAEPSQKLALLSLHTKTHKKSTHK